ncbi:MAG TPA: radical SAM protein, partial [Candidatus Eisenbacteria bacterium]|nr:radical SAM protein [Candidatus Eisenbacteria bacterium]
MECSPLPLVALRAPKVPLLSLDTVWVQVAGTLCNLACRHCFISCGPGNRSHQMMSRDEVGRYLDEAASLGVKDFYFTGGEPLLNKELPGILEDALRIAPATVLTNATLIDDRRAEELAALARGTPYSFEVRISLDGLTPETNDPIRGEGSFRTTIRGVDALHRAGLLPILTVAQTWSDAEDAVLRERFHELLRSLGITRPRVK